MVYGIRSFVEDLKFEKPEKIVENIRSTGLDLYMRGNPVYVEMLKTSEISPEDMETLVDRTGKVFEERGQPVLYDTARDVYFSDERLHFIIKDYDTDEIFGFTQTHKLDTDVADIMNISLVYVDKRIAGGGQILLDSIGFLHANEYYTIRTFVPLMVETLTKKLGFYNPLIDGIFDPDLVRVGRISSSCFGEKIDDNLVIDASDFAYPMFHFTPKRIPAKDDRNRINTIMDEHVNSGKRMRLVLKNDDPTGKVLSIISSNIDRYSKE